MYILHYRMPVTLQTISATIPATTSAQKKQAEKAKAYIQKALDEFWKEEVK